jgi:hypothetical protein
MQAHAAADGKPIQRALEFLFCTDTTDIDTAGEQEQCLLYTPSFSLLLSLRFSPARLLSATTVIPLYAPQNSDWASTAYNTNKDGEKRAHSLVTHPSSLSTSHS